jgi:hypothetical protein
MRERLPQHTSDSMGKQRMVCNRGYKVQECSQQLAVLSATLDHYHGDRVSPWTWVLVKSEDWKRIVRSLHGNADSPAFTVLDLRETFLEEALFVPIAGRSAELLQVWSVPLDKFLSLAVTHELGHAICSESDEARADRFGALLRQGNEGKCFGANPDAGPRYQVHSKVPTKMN